MSFYYASFNNKGFVKLYSYCSTRIPPPQDITTFIFIFIFMSRCCSYLYFHRTCVATFTLLHASAVSANMQKPDSIPIEPGKKQSLSAFAESDCFLSFNLTAVSSCKALLKIYFLPQRFQYLVQQIDAAVAFLPFDTAVIIDRHITAFGHVVLGQPQLQPQLI